METNQHETTTSMNDTLSAAGLLVESNKATEEMKKSISKFASLLICPLCNKVRAIQANTDRVDGMGFRYSIVLFV